MKQVEQNGDVECVDLPSPAIGALSLKSSGS